MGKYRRLTLPVCAALLVCAALQAAAEIVYHEDFEGDPAAWPITVFYRGQEPRPFFLRGRRYSPFYLPH